MISNVLVGAPAFLLLFVIGWLALNGGHWKWNPPRYKDEDDDTPPTS